MKKITLIGGCWTGKKMIVANKCQQVELMSYKPPYSWINGEKSELLIYIATGKFNADGREYFKEERK